MFKFVVIIKKTKLNKYKFSIFYNLSTDDIYVTVGKNFAGQKEYFKNGICKNYKADFYISLNLINPLNKIDKPSFTISSYSLYENNSLSQLLLYKIFIYNQLFNCISKLTLFNYLYYFTNFIIFCSEFKKIVSTFQINFTYINI